jgi:hypothetical protein
MEGTLHFGVRAPRTKRTYPSHPCAAPRCPRLLKGCHDYCPEHRPLRRAQLATEVSCAECREVLIRLREAAVVLVKGPAKRGRPPVYVNMECLWEQFNAVEALLRHLEEQKPWRVHLAGVGMPEWLRAAIPSVRPGIQHRAIAPVARLTGMNVRAIHRRITEFYQNRAAWFYLCVRPPDRPVVYSVGNVFVPND